MKKQNELFLKHTIRDPSIVNVVWSNRLNQEALPIDSTVERDYYSSGVLSHGQEKYGKNPTIVGLHNGTGFGQDQSEPFKQKRQLDPYPYPNGPYESSDLKDIMNPTMHVNELASSGGNPLTIALDDLNMIDQFIDSEKRRNYPFNPLSAAYARKAMEKLQEHPVLGPENDSMRRTMLDDQEHAETKGRKIAAGFYSERVQNNGVVALNPEIQSWLDGRAPPTRADFQNLHHRIAEAVHHHLGGNVADQHHAIQNQLAPDYHFEPNNRLQEENVRNALDHVQDNHGVHALDQVVLDRDGHVPRGQPPEMHNVGGDQQPPNNNRGLNIGGEEVLPRRQGGWLDRLGDVVDNAFGMGWNDDGEY